MLHIASVDFCNVIAKGGSRVPCAAPLATLLIQVKHEQANLAIERDQNTL